MYGLTYLVETDTVSLMPSGEVGNPARRVIDSKKDINMKRPPIELCTADFLKA